MFLEQALKQTVDLMKPVKILDLSAAPGGKSTHIESLISGKSLLVSNEVIRSRARVLEDNNNKWGCKNVMVTNNDPKDFERLPGFFDVIIVDAPCSGSGLFRKDEQAIKEWSEQNVQLCSHRQQRILVDVWPALKKDGVLIYSTCSYSREEDEDIVDWMKEEFKVENVGLRIEKEWGIVETPGGYRFWPDKLRGEGFFIAVMKKTSEQKEVAVKGQGKITTLSKSERMIVLPWLSSDFFEFIKNRSAVYAWPAALRSDMEFLLEKLRVIYSGVKIGELVREKLVPDHALAMSGLVSEKIPRVELYYDQAIKYLQKKELDIDMKQTGWKLVTPFPEDVGLGWINVLHNRVNNYYPKELRILKDR